MRKIPTIFDRDWDGDRTVIDKLNVDFDFKDAIATEKLDGMNVRLTIRNHELVRLEKRCNPTKIQKAKGIEDPWYKDADEYASEDKYLWEAAKNRDYKNIDDGEWSGEALGENIQGNPLKLKGHTICLFSCGEAPILESVPLGFSELREYLKATKSLYGNDCGIEGIVWHSKDGRMVKIKTKDFEKDARLNYENTHKK